MSIGGSINNFRTDMRIFNPSTTKSIQIQAYLLPVGGKDGDNSGVQPKTITVPMRSMLEYDDVVSSLFGASGLGGIRLNSGDDFVATQRVYATAADGSTNGQFVAGVDQTQALMNGVIIQMKVNTSFRTNIGIVNPNSVAANVTWKVYDKNNAQVGQPFSQKLAPFAVIGPSVIAAFQNPGTPSADLSDTWIAFSSDQPVVAYGSVIDNKNSAGTYVAAAQDNNGTGSAKDLYLSVGGSVGSFRTDMRIFNPSPTKDIQIQAYLLPVGNVDNSGVQPKTITVPKRSMLVYDDVVSSLFNTSGLGGIRLNSGDDFIATQRVYATAADGSTNGQFVAGIDESAAAKNGAIIQMKSNGATGQARTFRTNIGVVNPNVQTANVTWRVYDKSNNLVGQPFSQSLPPLGVIGPSAISAFQNPGSPSADLSDTWITYSSDQAIISYGSVIDNLNNAGTYVAAASDSGGAAYVAPPTNNAHVYNITERNFSITLSPAIGVNDLKPGDMVTFHITVMDSNHGFELDDPNGVAVIPGAIFSPGQVIDKTWTVGTNGTYNYYCTNTLCGAHTGMAGQFVIGMDNGGGGPHYKH